MTRRTATAALLAATVAVLTPQTILSAADCFPTGFQGLTAALINPAGTLTGTVDATGCNIAVYYDTEGAGGTVQAADIHGANYYGIVVNGDAGTVNVDILNSTIRAIGENPHNGSQHGVAVYYRGFFSVSSVTGKIAGNIVSGYQKGGIVANGPGTQVMVSDNTVTGDGEVTYIAQNGIQIGYGATASVMRNSVTGNSYIGSGGWSSGGILVVGGAEYGTCPDGSPCPLTVNTRIVDNRLDNNDVGVYLSNWDAAGPPSDATNVKVVGNLITAGSCYNTAYTAAISDVGNNDKLINNTVSGFTICSTLYNPGSALIDADASFTNRPKVHATK